MQDLTALIYVLEQERKLNKEKYEKERNFRIDSKKRKKEKKKRQLREKSNFIIDTVEN